VTAPLILIPTHRLDPTEPHIIAEPNACALCAIPERQHVQHYFGQHLNDDRKGWVAPDDQTRLARMRARRAQRQADEFDAMIAELDAAIVKAGARVRFWTCPVRAHRERRDENGWPAGTVEWRDGIAHCTAPGCDQTSRLRKAAEVLNEPREDS